MIHNFCRSHRSSFLLVNAANLCDQFKHEWNLCVGHFCLHAKLSGPVVER